MSNTVIQFSGGRTSAYMLWLYLQEHGGTTPDDCVVCFENTGKEREETLEFINEVERRWNVPIMWLEFNDKFDKSDYLKPDGSYRKRKLRKGTLYRLVDFKTASRNGEPFDRLIDSTSLYRKTVNDAPPLLPNPTMRICTDRLKLKVVRSFATDLGMDEYDTYLGIRADESHRRVRMLDWLPSNENLITPLIDLGVTKQIVGEFWASQPFDLNLDLNSDEGNCDLCFLKSTAKLVRIMKKYPSMSEWWINAEKRTGQNFSNKKFSFTALQEMINTNDPRLQKFNTDIDKGFDCFCGSD